VAYHADTFESAEEFKESISITGQGCLVLDIRLPGMSGLDLQEKLASSGVTQQVISMTAHRNPFFLLDLPVIRTLDRGDYR
jgi:FixJ family two-component response regulator